MDSGRHKEEPPDEEKSEESEISQKGKEEWSPPIESDPSQETKCEQGQTDLRFKHGNKNVNNHGKSRRTALIHRKCLKTRNKSELGQTGQVFRLGK
ncbi:hypothetical protein JTB14_000284 [Gonioctena quinquepunctata]|nr:hypothetical protein JTB14_000284 [Gonioctena quinquepunctata]